MGIVMMSSILSGIEVQSQRNCVKGTVVVLVHSFKF